MARATRPSDPEEGVENGSAFAYQTVTTYNPAGQPVSINPPGHGSQDQTVFSYDASRGSLFVTLRTDPLVGATSFEYDPFNRRTLVTDVNGVSTESTYEARDRVTAVIRKGASAAEDLVTTNVYDEFGDLFRIILPEGNSIEYGYDAAGRLVSTERKPDAATRVERTFLTLDGSGNRVREDLQRWDGDGWVTDSFTGYEFSARCHLDKIFHADGTVTEHAYDCSGNLERVWDANHPSDGQSGPSTQLYAYDPLDRLISVSQPWTGAGGGAAVTTYGYDVGDHIVAFTDAEGNATLYTYSDRDLVTREESPVRGVTTFRYDEHGELTEETDAREVTVSRDVDVLGRVLFVDFPGNDLDTSYTYDTGDFGRGRLAAISRAGESVDYRYDRFGRLTQDGLLETPP